jgi:Tfp pilus assembly protein PilN
LTRINLLPPERVKAKRVRAERSYWWVLPILPIIVIVALGFWFVSLNSQLSEKDKALTAAQTELADWQAKNAQLQQYKARQDQITSLEQTVVSALKTRVYWARILNDIAITMPKDVWLGSLSGSSSGGSGSVTFQAFALQCPNRNMGGMFVFYPDYRPVAGWLDRMAQIPEFQRVWLSGAQPTRQGVSGGVTPEGQVTGAWVISFGSTATLNPQTSVIAGTSTATTAPAATTPTPAPAPSSVGGTGGEAK